MTEPKCPIRSPALRVRALIVFEVIRATMVLAIMGWWGWLLVEQAERIAELTNSPVAHETRTMIAWEAVSVFGLVVISTLLSLGFYMRDLRRSRALQAFFAAMAHELRTPLASIRLQAESIASKLKSKSPYVCRLIADTSRLEAQVERGLELARAESGKPLAVSPISLDESWKRALALFPAENLKQLKITKTPLANALGDAHVVQVIFRNLIENALGHSGKKSVAIFVHTVVKDGQTVFIFRDNGKGFQGDSRRLGKLFFKAQNSKGTGIGLYLVRSLMRAQGGSAKFDGIKGFSATLSFRSADHA